MDERAVWANFNGSVIDESCYAWRRCGFRPGSAHFSIVERTDQNVFWRRIMKQILASLAAVAALFCRNSGELNVEVTI